MRKLKRQWFYVQLIVGATTFAGVPSIGEAEPISRIEEVPGGGWVGDLWTFRCPAGGAVEVLVDTLGDVPLENSIFGSGLDPAVDLFDGQGNLIVQGDDEVLCTAPSFCEAGCPGVRVTCGSGINHTLVIRDSGFLPGCFAGGTYQFTIEVFGAGGASRSQRQVKLGGGPPRDVPPLVLGEGFSGRSGPVVDDGPVALSVFGPFNTTEALVSVRSGLAASKFGR